MIFIEILDSLHQIPILIDAVPINAATHLARITLWVLVFIFSCVLCRYGLRFERAKALGMALDLPKWFLFLHQWPGRRWTLKNAVGVFLLYFTGSVIFQMLFPVTTSFDVAWIVIGASLYASLTTFMTWSGYRRRVKPEIFVS